MIEAKEDEVEAVKAILEREMKGGGKPGGSALKLICIPEQTGMRQNKNLEKYKMNHNVRKGKVV